MVTSPTRPKRRIRKEIGGIVYLRCECPIHKGKWLAEDHFGIQTYKVKHGPTRKIRKKWCKQYYRIYSSITKYPHLEEHGRVHLDKMEKWIYELVRLCGGFNRAARTLGTSSSQVYRWLRRYKGHNARYMSLPNAKRILTTVQGLRAGTLQPAPQLRAGGIVYKRGCKECGTPYTIPSPECGTCWEREYRRAGLR